MSNLFRKATCVDLTLPAKGLNLSMAQILELPEGSLFTKSDRWCVKTQPSLKKLSSLFSRSKNYFTSLERAQEIFGSDSVLAVRFAGHRYSEIATYKKFGRIPAIPVQMGKGYSSYQAGWCEEFSQSTVGLHDIFEHEGKNYKCIYRYRSNGDAYSRSIDSIIAVNI